MTKEELNLLVDWFEKNRDHRLTFLEKEAVKLELRRAETVNDLLETALKLLKKG